MIKCAFSDVSERDMDMLISEEVVSSADFLAIFLERVGIESASVLSVELSKSDSTLGESDITVIIESDGDKIGLLIEDKIDAIAMPDQAMRYHMRGRKGIEQGDYAKFFVFIVAPQKYLSENNESKNIRIASLMRNSWNSSRDERTTEIHIRHSRLNRQFINRRLDIRS